MPTELAVEGVIAELVGLRLRFLRGLGCATRDDLTLPSTGRLQFVFAATGASSGVYVENLSDGTRFFGIARTIERGGGGFQARRKSFDSGVR